MEVLKTYDEVLADVRAHLRTNPHLRNNVETLIAASKSNGTLEQRIKDADDQAFAAERREKEAERKREEEEGNREVAEAEKKVAKAKKKARKK